MEEGLNWMILPKELAIGIVYRILFGMLYLLFTKLQQKIRLSTGDMTGVCVDKYWMFEDDTNCGYVPNVRPTRLPQF